MRTAVTTIARRWISLALFILLGVGAAALGATAVTPLYTATTEIFVQRTGDSTSTSPGARTVDSYAAILEGRGLTDPTADELEIARGLADRVEASPRGGADVIRLSVDAENPADAVAISGNLADRFIVWLDDAQPDDGPRVTAQVVSPPSASATPTTPDWQLWLLIGGLIGAALGLVTTYLRTLSPSVVGSPDAAKNLTDAPVLAAIAVDGDVRNRPLLADLEPHHPRHESIRILRTNLQFLNVDRSQRVLTITSALPGEGKSTTSCNLAHAIAESGRSVALVEGDLRRPRLASLLGLEKTVGLTTALVGRVPLESALQSSGTPGLDVLTSGTLPPNPSEILQTDAMIGVLAELRERYDLVLIDAPPLLPVTDGALLASMSDGAIVLVRHGRTREADLRAAAERLRAVGARVLGTVLTMTPRREAKRHGYGSGYGYGPEYFTHETATRTRGGGRRAAR